MHERTTAASLSTTLALHLLPGFVVALFYLVTAERVVRIGLPRLLALLLGFALVGIPTQLLVIRTAARAAGHSVVRYRHSIPVWQHLVGAVSLIMLVFGLLQLPLGAVSRYLAVSLFWWVPPAFASSADDQIASFAHAPVLATLILQLVVDGIVNPLVEEIYFRGYLLPQLERFGWLAPVVNTTAFAIGHFWQPHNYVSIFVYVLPLTLFTWWRKNFYVQAFIHCLANTVGAVAALVMFYHGAL